MLRHFLFALGLSHCTHPKAAIGIDSPSFPWCVAVSLTSGSDLIVAFVSWLPTGTHFMHIFNIGLWKLILTWYPDPNHCLLWSLGLETMHANSSVPDLAPSQMHQLAHHWFTGASKPGFPHHRGRFVCGHNLSVESIPFRQPHPSGGSNFYLLCRPWFWHPNSRRLGVWWPWQEDSNTCAPRLCSWTCKAEHRCTRRLPGPLPTGI